jgi:hypothetical protein
MASPVKRKWWLLLAAVVLALVVLGTMRRDGSPLRKAFDEIRIGMTGEQAETILAGVSGGTDGLSMLREGSIVSVIVSGEAGDTVILRCRRNTGKVFSGSVVGKEYKSSFMMAVQDWLDGSRTWLRPARTQQARIGPRPAPVAPMVTPRGPIF